MTASGATRFGAYTATQPRYVRRLLVYRQGRFVRLRYVWVRYFPPQPYRPQPRPVPQPTPPSPKPTPLDRIEPQPIPPSPKPTPLDRIEPQPIPPSPKPTPLDRIEPQPIPPSPKPTPLDRIEPQPIPPSPKPTPTGRTEPQPKPPGPAPVNGGGGGATDRQTKLDRVRGLLDPKGLAALDRLGAKLDEKDLKSGKTTLDHLNELAEKGVDEELLQFAINKGTILSELVQELADPGIIHQSNRGTCAATTVQYYMATNHPAEYARVVAGFMNGGRVEMASGKTFVRDPGSIQRDNSSRNHIDRMFQTAAMDRSELGDYWNQNDLHVTGRGGMTQQDVTDLMNDFTAGKDGRFQTVAGNDAGIVSRIARSTSEGIEVPVGMRWSVSGRDAGHEVLVTKIENGQVYLRNPWGKDETARANNGPLRQLVNNHGDIVMSLAEFQGRLMFSSLS